MKPLFATKQHLREELDAQMAKSAILERALTDLAFYASSLNIREEASKALEEAHAKYRDVVNEQHDRASA